MYLSNLPSRKNWIYLALISLLFIPATVTAENNTDTSGYAADGTDAHNALLSKSPFPSAAQCQTCHPDQYREWSASPHAYAQISPVFNAMHNKLVKDTNGTLGDFCIRCHTPVGMQLGEPVALSNLERSSVSVEGVTCVTCHRRVLEYGKTSARYGLEAGNIHQRVYGPNGNEELKRVIEDAAYGVTTVAEKPGRQIHADALKNDQITTSAFCGTCHDVNGINGFRLEEAFSDYKSSPAAYNGVSCQDCHMGTKPGIASGYEIKPVALVGGKPTKPRKHANHRFIGPDYSIVHPGIFPHNPGAAQFASMKEWIQFDYKAGWGTPDFEDTVTAERTFPERWKDQTERFEARQFLDANQELLKEADSERLELLRVGYKLGEIRVNNHGADEVNFEVDVLNGMDGHSVPTGFDAERLVFLQVTVRDSSGKVLFRSGDLDPNGDVRDSHSQYVHNGQLPRDEFLLNLQSQFLVELVKGSERGQILNTNFSNSPLPFLRPPTNATLLLGRASGTRKHRQVIPPGGMRTGEYRIDAEQLKQATGTLCAEIKLIAGMVPVNLVYGIQEVGFDYNMSPREVADAVVAGHQVLAEKTIGLSSENLNQECNRE